MEIKVLNLDGKPDADGDIFDPNGLTFDEEVPVVRKFSGEIGDVIGTAKLVKREDGVYAVIKSYVGSLVGLYPSVAGRIDERRGEVLVRAQIKAVMVNGNRNSDSRIEPIKEG